MKGPQVRGGQGPKPGLGWAPSSVSAVIALLAPNREHKRLGGRFDIRLAYLLPVLE